MVAAFEKKIRSAVEDGISQKIEDAILLLDSKLRSLPKEIAVHKIAALNVTFVNDLVFSNSSIGLEINGLFTARDEVVGFSNYAINSEASLSCGGPSKMGGISIHENVLNSLSSVYSDVSPMCLSMTMHLDSTIVVKKLLTYFSWSGRSYALDY